MSSEQVNSIPLFWQNAELEKRFVELDRRNKELEIRAKRLHRLSDLMAKETEAVAKLHAPDESDTIPVQVADVRDLNEKTEQDLFVLRKAAWVACVQELEYAKEFCRWAELGSAMLGWGAYAIAPLIVSTMLLIALQLGHYIPDFTQGGLGIVFVYLLWKCVDLAQNLYKPMLIIRRQINGAKAELFELEAGLKSLESSLYPADYGLLSIPK